MLSIAVKQDIFFIFALLQAVLFKRFKPILMIRLSHLIMFLCTTLSACSQDADRQIRKAIDNPDPFYLQQAWTANRQHIRSEPLKLMSEALVSLYENKPEKTIEIINRVFDKHTAALEHDRFLELLLIKCRALNNIGAYQEIDTCLAAAINLLEQQHQTKGTDELKQIRAHNKQLLTFAPIALSRPSHDVTIPVTRLSLEQRQQQAGTQQSLKNNAQLLQIPVTVHGQEHLFVFDTGASRTYLSAQKAQEMGVKLLEGLTLVNQQHAIQEGFLDSLQVGGITVYNLPVYVGLPDETNPFFGFDAILGLDFMKAIGETQIYYRDKKIVFPAHFTPLPATGSNMLIFNIPHFKAKENDKELHFKLDTGHATSELSYQYAKKNAEVIARQGVEETIVMGSYNQMAYQKVKVIPYITFDIGHRKVNITPIHVLTEQPKSIINYDGIMGMDLIRLSQKVTINFREMFLKVE